MCCGSVKQGHPSICFPEKPFRAIGGVLQSSTDRAERKKAFRRLVQVLEYEDPAYGVINQNATFTAKAKATPWTAAPSFAMDFRPTNWDA